MSLTLEIRGRTRGMWPLSTALLAHVERLRAGMARRSVEHLFGEEAVEAGTERLVARNVLFGAVNDLIPLAKGLPAAFQVRVPPLFGGKQEVVGRGIGGILIDGKYHVVCCWEDYWTLQETEEMRAGKQPVRRYDATTIPTENMGVLTIEPKNASQSDLVNLLRDIERFLKRDKTSPVTVVWG